MKGNDPLFGTGGGQASSSSQNRSGPTETDRMIGEMIDGFVRATGTSLVSAFKLARAHPFWFTLSTIALWCWSDWLVGNHLHLHALQWLEPSLFTNERLNWLWQRFEAFTHVSVIFGLQASFAGFLVGMLSGFSEARYRKIFERIGLKNRVDQYPEFVGKKRLNEYETLLRFKHHSIGVEQFRSKADELYASLEKRIKSIEYAPHNSSFVDIILSTKTFPVEVEWVDLHNQVRLPESSFFVGEGEEGIFAQDIPSLPHLLIAGATGTGKSVFFRQALMGLLISTNRVQMYLLDLKSGLEMSDFKSAPNAYVAKSIEDATRVLKLVDAEMRRRFEYLERNGKKKIDPQKDQFDRIIVAVDEASVLYGDCPKEDSNYHFVAQARKYTNNIAKMGRAAAIHLILATQKLDRHVLPTAITENVSARMAFKANSVEGSVRVLGTKDAAELPKIAGRGIWNFGAEKYLVQGPNITDDQIIQHCGKIRRAFELKERSLSRPMLMEPGEDTGAQKEFVQELTESATE